MKCVLTLLLIIITISGCSKKEQDDIAQSALSSVQNNDMPLQVKEGSFTGTTEIIPWSSWWFPGREKYLFESANQNDLAPLQKYDKYVDSVTNTDPESALFEEFELYDSNVTSWTGLCHAWAVASVLHAEPRTIIRKEDVRFGVADQKALLLKSYENVKGLEFYGTRYDGKFQDDFDDINPAMFHRIAQIHLFEKHLPFLMDYDPSFPVWTVPVYEIKFVITREGSRSVVVKAWVTTASSFVQNPNFVGTKKVIKLYEYRLFGIWQGEEFNVTDSEWINDARYDHPDFLIAYPDKAERASLNNNLDITMIDKILGQ